MERPNQPEGEHFSAAIARHQLALQTELKRSTSLPSAMFDASDPMLEARLCEATEALFRRLLDQEAPPDTDAPGEVRLEVVHAEELTAVVQAARRGAFAGGEMPSLAEGEQLELHVLLGEICARSHGGAQHRAAQLLRSLREDGDLEGLTRELATRLRGLDAGDATATEAMLAACRRLATTVLRCTAQAMGGPPP